MDKNYSRVISLIFYGFDLHKDRTFEGKSCDNLICTPLKQMSVNDEYQKKRQVIQDQIDKITSQNEELKKVA